MSACDVVNKLHASLALHYFFIAKRNSDLPCDVSSNADRQAVAEPLHVLHAKSNRTRMPKLDLIAVYL